MAKEWYYEGHAGRRMAVLAWNATAGWAMVVVDVLLDWPARPGHLIPLVMGITVLVLGYALYRVSRRWGPGDESRIGGIHLAPIFTDPRLFLGFVSKILFVPMLASGAVLVIVGIALAFF